MINSEMRDELYSYMGGIIKRHGGVLLKAGGIADHVHLIIKLKPAYALSEIMQKIKGSSSKWINEKQYLTDRFSWQEGYGAFTISESQISTVIRYVGEQEKHHEKMTYKDEFSLILERNKVEFDERYLWS